MSLAPHQSKYIKSLLPDVTPEEMAHYEQFHAEDGWFMMDPRPVEGRETLLIYAACAGVAFRNYFEHVRPEIREHFVIHHIFDHALVIHILRNHEFPLPRLVPRLFREADALLYHPISGAYEELSDSTLVRLLKPNCKAVRYTGPHHGCWWPICPHFGEQPVVRYLEKGLTPDEIWVKFLEGTFDPLFEERFKLQMEWLRGYETANDVRLTGFIERNYRKAKLFLTDNHASFHLIAYIADKCMGALGFPEMGEEHAVSLSPEKWVVGAAYPETHYEFDYYKFEYPMRFADTWGGITFYRDRIHEAFERWKKAKGGEINAQR